MVTVRSDITVEYPDQKIIDQIKNELVFDNPEFSKKQRMGFSTYKTPRQIHMEKWLNDWTVVLPAGCLDWFKEFDDLRACKPVEVKGQVSLFDYQENAVTALYGAENGILQAPAGSGKTQMALALAGRLKQKTIWVTHTKDLLNQSYDRAAQYYDKSTLGKITEGKMNCGSFITFATVQTLFKCDLDALKNEFGLIIVDECHRVSGTPTTISMFSKVLNTLNSRYRFGITATVHRADGMIKATTALLGPVRYQVPEEVTKSRIVKPEIRFADTGAMMPACGINPDGTICWSKLLNGLAEDPDRVNAVVTEMEKDNGCSMLVLSDRVRGLEAIQEALPDDMKKNSALIDGKTKKSIREQAIEDMRSGKKKILLASYSLAKEGLDIPCLSRLYLTTPQKDYAVITQAIGRIARVHEGKPYPVAVDFVDSFPMTWGMLKKRKTIYRKLGYRFE